MGSDQLTNAENDQALANRMGTRRSRPTRSSVKKSDECNREPAGTKPILGRRSARGKEENGLPTQNLVEESVVAETSKENDISKAPGDMRDQSGDTLDDGKTADFITASMLVEEDRAEEENAPLLTIERLQDRVDRNSAKYAKLEELLNKAGVFSAFLSNQLPEVASRHVKDTANKAEVEEKESARKRRKRGRGGEEGHHGGSRDPSGTTDSDLFAQPKLLTGGNLRDYQREGVGWIASLYENGLNGILADEMGLGKTLQVIGFLAHLREHCVNGPFLVVAPLSTLPNWIKEVAKWLPSCEAVLYHGSAEERAELRAEKLRPSNQNEISFPIVVTSYEIAIRDRKFLALYQWKYLVVDEGHRLKNMNCRLIKELKRLPSDNRILLTGTPLQNNLPELWSLLNFILPDVFDDLEMFEQWFAFDLETESQIIDAESNDQLVTKLHDILRPFLLRRLKRDVLTELPKKSEIVVYAGKSKMQEEYTRKILSGTLQEHLTQKFGKNRGATGTGTMNNMLMQLRKCCNHPFLFGGFVDDKGEYKANRKLVESSGKLRLLDRLLLALKKKMHKVLIFSQMTSMLDILEDYLEWKGWAYCRIDGETPALDRQGQMDAFNEDPEIFCFLLSTRAGGLGINLIGGDTVIIYDSDWNPHQDNQAQDRCHRIGQGKPVIVYRLVTENSVETRLLERAISKRKLERVVIQRGNFRKVGRKNENLLTKNELQSLLKDDFEIRKGEETGGLDDEELALITDRQGVMDDKVPSRGSNYEIVEQYAESLLD